MRRMRRSERLIDARRRSVLRAAAVLGASVSIPGISAVAQAPRAPSLVPRALYFARDDYSNVRVSPDGTQLSYLSPVNGVRNIFVAPIGAPGSGRQLTRVTDRDIAATYQWAYNNRHIVFFQERDGDENWRASSVDIASGAVT